MIASTKAASLTIDAEGWAAGMVGFYVSSFLVASSFSEKEEERSLGEREDGEEGVGIWEERMHGAFILESEWGVFWLPGSIQGLLAFYGPTLKEVEGREGSGLPSMREQGRDGEGSRVCRSRMDYGMSAWKGRE